MPIKLKIEDAIILVTGAGQGIGRALVTEILRRGGRPIAVEFNPAFEAGLTEQIRGNGAVHIADVRDAAQMTAIAEQTIRDFGGIDIVIANAGIERVAPTVDMPPELFEVVLDTNIQGVYRTLQPALASVISRKGHVLAISSIAALIPFPMATAYSTSKAAVDMMMRVLRMELTGTGATAGAAYFGFVQTDMADRIFSDAYVSKTVDSLPCRPLGIKPLPSADQVATKILDGIHQRRARVYAPWMVRVTFALRGLYPNLDGVLARFIMRIDDRIAEFRDSRRN
jgi:NAD(P)-dependent dehydrogenase (short-subunit alcohol dehydrogenase family)